MEIDVLDVLFENDFNDETIKICSCYDHDFFGYDEQTYEYNNYSYDC